MNEKEMEAAIYVLNEFDVGIKEWDKKVRLIERNEDSRRFNEMLDLFQEAFEIVKGNIEDEIRAQVGRKDNEN